VRDAFAGLTIVLAVALPPVATAQPLSPLADPTPGTTVCPLDRVAMVRGSDSEAREGGGSMPRAATAFTARST